MPAPGDLLAGRYRILAPLGSGGMATVHRARDERLEREVAIKVLLPNHAGDPVLATRFEREARALAAASHPGVVAVFDVDAGDPAAGREPYFVMELCGGGSLAARLAGGQRLPPDELVPIVISIADGLSGLHERGIVHRDVKPHNILLAPERAKLADFGLARGNGPAEASELTAPGTTVGTMAYLAPEVLGGRPATAPSDVYALGVAAFVGLTGSLPRPVDSVTALVEAGAAPAPLVSELAPELGAAFDEPIAAALAADPSERPDALTFASMLTTALGRWSRGRHGAAAPEPRRTGGPPVVVPPPGGPQPTPRPEATTAALRMAATAVVPGAGGGPAERAARRRADPGGPGLVAATALAALALLAVGWLAIVVLGGPGGSAGVAVSSPSPAPSATPSPSASPTPSPSPTPPPTPPPTPAPTPTRAERALAALDEVDAAIVAVARSGDLRNREVNDLEKRARAVRSALEGDDLDGARREAGRLRERVDDLADRMDEDAHGRLAQAVDELRSILGGD